MCFIDIHLSVIFLSSVDSSPILLSLETVAFTQPHTVQSPRYRWSRVVWGAANCTGTGTDQGGFGISPDRLTGYRTSYRTAYSATLTRSCVWHEACSPNLWRALIEANLPKRYTNKYFSYWSPVSRLIILEKQTVQNWQVYQNPPHFGILLILPATNILNDVKNDV